MRVCKIISIALVVLLPALAFAQDAEEDEFYQDPDETSEGDQGESGTSGSDVSVSARVDSDENQLAFRGTSIIYENIMSAQSSRANLSAEAAFYYAMSYSFRPRYYVRDWLSLRLRLDLEQELTDSASTVNLREPLLSDTWLDIYFSNLLESVSESFDLGTYIRFGFPSSKLSRARTMIMSTTLGVVAKYTIPVLEGLTLTYGINGTRYFNQDRTAQYEGSIFAGACTPTNIDACDPELHRQRYDSGKNTGVFNPAWLLRNTVALDLSPIEKLTFSLSVTFYNYWVYPQDLHNTNELPNPPTTTDPDGNTVRENGDVTMMRGSIWYIVEVSYEVLPWMGLALGASTFNPHLDPGSDYYAPFFNINTNVYLDISLSIDGIVNAVRGRRGRTVSSRQMDEV